MKNLTSYLLAAALFAGPVLLVQAAEEQPADGQQTEHAQGQQNAPNTPQVTPAPSEQGGGNQTEEMTPTPSEQGGDKQTEGMSQSNESANETLEQSSTAGGSQFIEEESAQQMLASDLMGYSVTNLQGENVGQVNDLILDQDHRPVGIVISVGGFLGMGAKHVALPMSEVKINRENKVVQISFSKEEVNKAPLFKAQKAGQNGSKEGDTGSTSEQ